MADIFLSYSSERSELVTDLAKELENRGVSCWYAPRNITGDYATSIINAIEKCRAFVVLIDERAAVSPHVLNEIEAAYHRLCRGEIPVIPVKLDDAALPPAANYYLSRMQWVTFAGNVSVLMPELAKQLEAQAGLTLSSLDEPAVKITMKAQLKDRTENHYFDSDDTEETRRLAIQEELLREFDADVYQKHIIGKQDLTVLDIGSNDGRLVMDRLGSKTEVKRIFGLEIDEGAVASANEQFGSNLIRFRCCDCESDELDEVLSDYLAESNLEGFDIVNMSLIVLHLKKPYKVLKAIRKHMTPSGTVIIRDVEDSLDLAYPDKKGHFARSVEVCDRLETTGFRHSGRQVYGLLKRAGFREIQLEKQGLTTIGMDYEQRDAFFHAGFSYLRPHIEKAIKKDPSNKQLAEDLNWIRDSYDDMEEQFHGEDFFYQAGCVVFTAKVAGV